MPSAIRRLYFDHNASAPLLPEARAALIDALDRAGNPSSVHSEGRRARALVETARREIAALVGADPQGVVFTSGASEAANAVLSPLWHREGVALTVGRVAVAATDHPCLQEGGRFAAERVTRLPVDRDGHVLHGPLAAWLDREDGNGVPLLAVTLANNESGIVQPVAPIRDIIAGRDVLFVLDAVQAVGRMPVDIKALGADALILSGHKIGAMPGVGAFILRDPDLAPTPLIVGGAQERRRRAGTEAVAAIASFGAAARIAAGRGVGDRERLNDLRSRLEAELRRADRITIIGEGVERLPNTVFFQVGGLRAETLQIGLDLAGFAVSAGSACASGKVGPSPVLAAHTAAGLDIDPAAGALRISFGFETTEEEIDAMARAVGLLVRRAGSSGPVAQVA